MDGSFPWILVVAGAAGSLVLLFAPRRWYARRAVPIATTTALVVTAILRHVVEKVWRPFPDPIALDVYVWIGIGLASLFLLVPRVVAARRRILAALGALVATVVIVAMSAAQVNIVYGEFPTLGDALGLREANRIDFSAVPGPTATTVTGSPLEPAWTPPVGMPSVGAVAQVAIPGTASGFDGRDAQIYLPPAYFTDPRPLLPVLVLVPGQPGQTDDWLKGGKMPTTMDDFAARHGGLAPVVVVADATGSVLANPMCMDSQLGNVATYLAKDVPAWVTAHLQVDPDPRAWAFGGLSYGGTCALQMATNYPQVYPTFLDLSGQTEPTIGDRKRSVDAAFGGDTAAFEKVNPADLLKKNRYPDSAGVFVVGDSDHDFAPGQHEMFDAAAAAGMDVHFAEYRGGHSWVVWSAALRGQIDWLARRLGLIE